MEVLKSKRLSSLGVAFMICSIVFNFNNSALAFYKLGYSSIIFYIVAAVTFFIPLAFIIVEYSTYFNKKTGGIYSWMEATKGGLYGFVAIVIWYFGIIVYLSTTSIKIWIPLSVAVFGSDITSSLSFFGLNSTQSIGILALFFVVVSSFISTRGFNKIASIAKLGGLMAIFINMILYFASFILFFVSKGNLAQPIEGIGSFFSLEDSEYFSVIPILSFVVFAVFAYGGIESIGSLSEKTKSAKAFAIGIIISSIIISVGYSLSILCFGFSSSFESLANNSSVNMGNVLFILMRNLGFNIGTVFGFDEAFSSAIGAMFTKVVGFSVFISFLGAYFTLIYAPLKTILDGAPHELISKKLIEKNKNNMPKNAMFVQALIISVIVALVSFGGQAAKLFYEIITSMANVSLTLPYLFIIFAFPSFKKSYGLKQSYKIFKSNVAAYFVCALSFIVVLFGNVFTIVSPLFRKNFSLESGILEMIFIITGPILFGSIAVLIYRNYNKKLNS